MRQRENSYDINTLLKFKITKNNNIERNKSKKDDNYNILKDYISSNIKQKEPKSPFIQEHNIELKPPEYEFQKRMYISKDKHIKFHEKASIVKLDQGVGSEISSCQKSINFINLMAMFEEDEINDFDIEKLLNIDLEKNKMLKEKLGKIIGYVEQCNCSDSQIKTQVLSNLNEKMKQLNNNEINVNNVIGNIENIDKIVYGNEETKVVFQNK